VSCPVSCWEKGTTNLLRNSYVPLFSLLCWVFVVLCFFTFRYLYDDILYDFPITINKDTCCDDSVVTCGYIVVITAYNVNVYFFS